MAYVPVIIRREGTHYAKQNEDHKQNKLRGFSPPANYTDRATAACRRS
jgi:hypothetical protein